MDHKKAKKITAALLKIGETKVYISPSEGQRIKEAMTKEDVRVLIKDGVIKKRKDDLQSKSRARVLKEKKKKGRKKGHGKRTGKKTARSNKKEKWIKNVRAQRRVLKEMKESNAKLKKPARQIYLMIKGGYFKGKKYVQSMVEEAKK
ncbi:MAG: 50S ribosomal protein L19e [Candidatus Diapherotrites archaeon]|uniref:50S ribosomal protein L19e n=1 Tax=Candidatus Iainarchaeum sp. TaxID=3101447 RepID=A0A2D6LPC6_9ARCH|nr:50S ribosomal protein L19e [Candidatus Diapherotrites archaeon]|tara:strand:+ start:4779 stop:5219 length:441 start_codon:yes stop_codon:yes gene_type:complete